jgi:hypothetical protein
MKSFKNTASVALFALLGVQAASEVSQNAHLEIVAQQVSGLSNYINRGEVMASCDISRLLRCYRKNIDHSMSAEHNRKVMAKCKKEASCTVSLDTLNPQGKSTLVQKFGAKDFNEVSVAINQVQDDIDQRLLDGPMTNLDDNSTTTD